MQISEIQEKLSEAISMSNETWGELLTDTEPGNYGANYWEVQLKAQDVWVDIPKRKYSFKNALFSFDVRLGGSSDESGSDMSFSKVAKGDGEFDFGDNEKIIINELNIKVDLDLFAED